MVVPPTWRFRRTKKYSPHGVVRNVSHKMTGREFEPLARIMGVTRVADITGLDYIGLPNFTTVRPREMGAGISYDNGKGIPARQRKPVP